MSFGEIDHSRRFAVGLHHGPPCHFPELCTSSSSSPSASIWASTPWRAARSVSSPLSTVSHLSVRACRPGKAWSSVSPKTPRTRISYLRELAGFVIELDRPRSSDERASADSYERRRCSRLVSAGRSMEEGRERRAPHRLKALTGAWVSPGRE